MTSLPIGTVTFLFTDIQGSTPLWERQPEKMAAVLQIHNAVLRGAIKAHGGVWKERDLILKQAKCLGGRSGDVSEARRGVSTGKNV